MTRVGGGSRVQTRGTRLREIEIIVRSIVHHRSITECLWVAAVIMEDICDPPENVHCSARVKAQRPEARSDNQSVPETNGELHNEESTTDNTEDRFLYRIVQHAVIPRRKSTRQRPYVIESNIWKIETHFD